jgi:hypothetical protein
MKTALRIGLLCMASTLAFATTAPAKAAGYHGYKYGHHYRHGHRGYHHRRHHRRHRGHHSNEAAYLAGGLILGSILTHAYHEPRRVVRRTVVHDPVVIRRTEGRRLFRDRDGNCFERTRSRSGDELLIELDRSECAW